MLIDADGCPIVNIAIRCAARHGVGVLLICDSAHIFERPGAETITVVKGADSADFQLVNMLQSGDIVITQDYGLAAMSLSRRPLCVLDQNGRHYTDDNIDMLLMSRHESRRLRESGTRLKGPGKRTRVQDEQFERALEAVLASASHRPEIHHRL